MNKQQFKQARIKLGLSITELSKELGLGSPRWLRRIESTTEANINNKPSLQLQKSFERLIKERS